MAVFIEKAGDYPWGEKKDSKIPGREFPSENLSDSEEKKTAGLCIYN